MARRARLDADVVRPAGHDPRQRARQVGEAALADVAVADEMIDRAAEQMPGRMREQTRQANLGPESHSTELPARSVEPGPLHCSAGPDGPRWLTKTPRPPDPALTPTAPRPCRRRQFPPGAGIHRNAARRQSRRRWRRADGVRALRSLRGASIEGGRSRTSSRPRAPVRG